MHFTDERDDTAGFLIFLGLILGFLIFAALHYHLNKPKYKK